MPIRFTCPTPSCGKLIVVKDEFAGRTGKCPGCQSPVKVPAATPAFEVVEDDEPAPPPPPKKSMIVQRTPPPNKAKPVIAVEETPRPKKKPVIVVEDDDEPPPPKKKPVIIVEDDDAPPQPKKKPVIVVEDDDDAPPNKKPAFVVEEDEPAPAPKKPFGKPAPLVAAAEVVEDDEEARPAAKPKGPPKKSDLKKSVPADYDDEILGRTEWYCREDRRIFTGKTYAGLFESYADKDAYAVVRDATWKLFGFLDIDISGLRPRFKFQLLSGDKNGPVLLTIERFVPRFDIPLKTPKPVRWEVRGPDDAVVGSLTLSRAGFNIFKFLTKGQIFQEENDLLDASGRKCGTIVVERARMAAPTYLGIVDEDGNEYGHFTSQFGQKMQGLMDDVKRTGKTKISVTKTVLGKGDEDERGYYGHVNPERADDPYARVMTLAMTVLLETLGYEAFGGTKSRKK